MHGSRRSDSFSITRDVGASRSISQARTKSTDSLGKRSPLAEDFVQIPGSREDIEVEVRGVLVPCMYLSEQSGWPTTDSVRTECAGEDDGCGHPV